MTALATPDRAVTVLMGCRNGVRHLAAQLDSIAAQRVDARIDVLASDDGSTDGTVAMLNGAAEGWTRGTFDVVAGPKLGFAENFRSLLQQAPAGVAAAFSDQDDIWMPDKLAVGMAAVAGAAPALYCGRTLLVDEADAALGMSPLFSRPPEFANALVQSIAGGNTMLMNAAALELVREAARRSSFVSHDWFCYQIVSGAGGRVTYDPQPRVRYRQHGDNLVGANTGWAARLDRLRRAWGGRFVEWNDQNVATLRAAEDLLTADARRRLEQFDSARRGKLLQRLDNLRRSGVYRQTIGGQISLWSAAVLGKL